MQKVYDIILSYHRFSSPGMSIIQVAKIAWYSLRQNLQKDLYWCYAYIPDWYGWCLQNVNQYIQAGMLLLHQPNTHLDTYLSALMS